MQPSSAGQQTTERFLELDSLRGLAAMMILVHHLVQLWIERGNCEPVRFPAILMPIYLGGDGAVVLFFVLSGFVLSLPAISGRPQSYFTFVTRRIFRIYVPYLAAVAISVCGAYWLHGAVIGCGLFHHCWSDPVSWALVGRHLLFLGSFNTQQFDPPVWSLVYEMRVSLFFPLLCAIALRLNKQWNAIFMVMLCSIAMAIGSYQNAEFSKSMIDTMYYAGFFAFGILLAREQASCTAWYCSLDKTAKAMFALLCIVVYLVVGPLSLGWHLLGSPRLTVTVSQWLKALSAGGFIVLALNSPASKRMLRWAPVHWVGKRSYSLYLTHYIVMLYCVHLLYGRVHLLAILGLVFVLSLAVAGFSYRFVELPSMNLGRRLGNLFSR
jgi:peptidoglycan/LPS O-acetylase OafA/YrhL